MSAAVPLANALSLPRRRQAPAIPLWDDLVNDLHEELDAYLAPPAGCRILELACGDGTRLEALAARAGGSPTAVGVDTHRQNIELARARSSLHLIRAEAAAFLEFTPAEWDVITARFCLPHVGWEKLPRRALAALAKGGRLGILTCLADSASEAWAMLSEMALEAGIRLPSPSVPMSANALESALRDAGFARVDVEIHARTVPFANADEAVRWLVSAGFASHPWLTLLDVETLSHLGESLAERMRKFDDGNGIRLTFNVASAVAEAPR